MLAIAEVLCWALGRTFRMISHWLESSRGDREGCRVVISSGRYSLQQPLLFNSSLYIVLGGGTMCDDDLCRCWWSTTTAVSYVFIGGRPLLVCSADAVFKKRNMATLPLWWLYVCLFLWLSSSLSCVEATLVAFHIVIKHIVVRCCDFCRRFSIIIQFLFVFHPTVILLASLLLFIVFFYRRRRRP